MDTDLYRFRMRFLDFFDDKTSLRGEKTSTNFCITWKRLIVQEATKTKGFSMILRVRVFDCSTENVSKRNQNRSRNKTRMVSWFPAYCRFRIVFGIQNQAKIGEKRSWRPMQKRKPPERARKRQWWALALRETRRWSSGEGEGEGVNSPPEGLGKITYR